jgi:hypothetical protein
MMERLRISSEQTRTILKDGTEVVAQKIETPRPIPGSTAHHEAAHVVASGEIVEATIIPHGDALGSARPVRMTAASAAAAGAMGHGGTGWDRFITENYLGVDWGTAKSAARAALSGKEDLMKEVAIVLEQEGTIGQYHVEEAKKRVSEKKQGIYPMKLEIYRSGRRVESITTKSYHGEVVISHLPTVSESGARDKIK